MDCNWEEIDNERGLEIHERNMIEKTNEQRKKEMDKNLQTMTRILSYLAKLDADKQEAAYRKIGRLLAVPAFPKALNQITVEDYDRIMKGNCK